MPKQKQKSKEAKPHTPVLLSEAVHYLKPGPGESYLDLTAGFGGHAQAVLNITSNFGESVLVDRDVQAIAALHSEFDSSRIRIIQKDFLSASKMLNDEDKRFDMIFADLGVSSLHLNEASRGFAFSSSGPLDMRMDQTQALSAELIVNKWSEKELTDVLIRYGQEPKARRIAKLIINGRPIKTTDQLASIVAKAWFFHKSQNKPGGSRVHPATRTFQALRIAVNDELGQLMQSLPLWLNMLKPGGRLAVISFHSLEDRIVKQFFAQHTEDTYDQEFELLTKKPVVATSNELVSNPRARSAKLRAVAKIKTQK